MSEKINYEPVKKTGILSSSIYEDGIVLTLGDKTHMALIKDSKSKFAVLEVVNAVDKDGNPCLLPSQDCEDGSFAVLAISALKIKKVFSTDQLTSNKRMSGGMPINEILSLEAGVQYRLSKKEDGYKKPFGWVEGDPLVQNNSYRLDAVTTEKPATQPTAKK